MSSLESYRETMRRRCKAANARICKNTKELNRAIADFMEASRAEAKAAICAAIGDAYTRLVKRTPVDTGRARAGWHIETELNDWKPGKRWHEEAQDEARTVIAEQMNKLATIAMTDADIIHIMNNVEYILALEAGHSKQSAGFTALFLEEVKKQLEDAVRELNQQ